MKMEFDVHLPNLLKEVLNNKGSSILRIPVNTTLMLLRDLAGACDKNRQSGVAHNDASPGVVRMFGKRESSSDQGTQGTVAERSGRSGERSHGQMREKNQETRADIIAEMRMGSPCGPCAYRIGLPDKEEVYESGAKRRITMIKNVTVQELADRLEAAAKREKAQHGNAAAMREALGDVYNILEKIQSLTPRLNDVSLMREFRGRVCHAKRVIDTAFSAPARNCDAMSAEECKRIFEEEMLLHLTSEATEEDKNLILTTAKSVIDDLLAPAAERKGEGDGSK